MVEKTFLIAFSRNNHLHVVCLTPAADFPRDVVRPRGGDEVVVFARLELQPSGGRGEGAEGDGEETFGRVGGATVAHRHLGGVGVTDPARLVVLFVHVVYYVPGRSFKVKTRLTCSVCAPIVGVMGVAAND